MAVSGYSQKKNSWVNYKPAPRLPSEQIGLRLRHIGFFLIAITLVMLPSAHAATSYKMPTLVGRWTVYTIGVKLPKGPDWANNEVLNAMSVWNQAQVWFKNNYATNGKLYTLAPTQDPTAKVIVVYHNLSRSAQYFTLGEAYTDVRFQTIYGSRMELTLFWGTEQTTAFALYMVAIHELGHVLGLSHTEVDTDIMYESISNNNANLPSTLDLYAVNQLAGGTVQELFTLPDTIGFQFVPDNAVPEFFALPFLFIFLFSGLAVIAKERKRGTLDSS